MSRELDTQLEHRISRCLDGEMTDTEQAELYRELLRDPAAHDVLSTSARYDQLAREALGQVISPSDREGSSGERVVSRSSRERAKAMRRWGGLAAAVALLVAGGWLVRVSMSGAGEPVDAGSVAVEDAKAEPGQDVATGPVGGDGTDAGPGEAMVRSGEPVVEPAVPRDVVGVVSDDRIFWIELTADESGASTIGDF